jgi:hypothetical protein
MEVRGLPTGGHAPARSRAAASHRGARAGEIPRRAGAAGDDSAPGEGGRCGACPPGAARRRAPTPATGGRAPVTTRARQELQRR